MIKSKLLMAGLFGCAMLVACDDQSKTPSGSAAPTSQASKHAAKETKSKAENASESAKDAAANAGKEVKQQAEGASDALKSNANAAASAVATQPSADADASKLQQALDYIKDKKWDLADSTLKELESRKASLPAALGTQVDSARKMLDAAKAGNGALPSSLSLPK